MKRILLLSFLLCMAWVGMAQTGEVRGVVFEKGTGVPIDFANVYLKENLQGTVTDENGFFTISGIKPGKYTLFCSYVGYDSAQASIVIEAGRVLTQNLYLPKADQELLEVTVNAEAIDKKENAQIGQTKITPKEMAKLVTLGGEPDLVQSLQILPGVYSSGDQGGQLYVRGGSPVMNKVLLDGMTIYQPFHSIGLFSVFDADIIKSADVYSAGFGAEFGGRISAVVDVNTREGNKVKQSGKIAVNPFTSKFMLEGPLKPYREGDGSISYILSYKNSYLKNSSKVFYPYLDENRLPYTFNDLYGKVSFVGSNGSKLDLFGFNFRDAVDFQGITTFKWNSTGFGSKFVVLPDESRIKMDGFFSYSNYFMEQQENDGKPRESGIQNFNIGMNFHYLMGKDQFVYGTEINIFETAFNFTNPNGRSIDQQESMTELSLYARYKRVWRRWVLEPGFRLQYYATFSEFFPEPRMALKYNITSKLRFKAAGGIYSQNLISAVSDRDVVNLFYGFLAGPDNLPDQFNGKNVTSRLQKAWHSVAGFEMDLGKHVDVLVEGYYKDFYQLTNINRDKIFDNKPEYADKPAYQRLDYIVENGKAYGIDSRVKYDNGSFYVWAVYSLTYVSRYDGIRTYFPHFDRRHNANLVLSYSWGKKKSWSANARWNFGSGFPFTQTASYYELLNFKGGVSGDYTQSNGDIGIIYSQINEGRLPYFHRLDVSVSKSITFSKTSKMDVVAGIINAYNRANIFYFDRVNYSRVDQLPILPSLGINWSF
ncbi:MAG: TonB-dependent receptor [Bacteroidota bacterium]|nr:TonB-dependent receptor [Bacteroidota bacterium]MDX5431887.1 TonB-dependent receptor [Bacteroidota bacterium]MDX5470601.1 TonB-dependent receptor [Bacteroidota bacterium]